MSNRVRSNGAPMNQISGFFSRQTIMFNIPCTSNTFIAPSEGYLKFGSMIINGSKEYIRIYSCCAHGLIQVFKIVKVQILYNILTTTTFSKNNGMILSYQVMHLMENVLF